ncbi:MAG: Glycerol-3-phosphate dehydrogenase, partial [Actinomycetota bacterium]
MAKVAVMGAGSWGTTFAKVLADAGNDVTLWARRDDIAEEINGRHRNADYLPGVRLPETLKASTDLSTAL